MRTRILTACVCWMFAGCAAREPVTMLDHESFATARVGDRPPNLALGPSATHGRLGEWFTYREDWPAATIGVRLEEVTTYSDVMFDDQAYYDRFGGGFFKVQDSVRTGVLLR